ncbi:hypothetical protein ACFRIB_32795 [Streptomyces mirabilis]|uniref:hypothetical protein n=1 Tax=Streptomyces mirabilis TaxID=68239 RepID=UPI0036CE5664
MSTLRGTPQRQVHPSPASSTVAARRRFAAQLGSSVLIFGLSVPLAFVNTEAAMWFWLTLIPAHYILDRHPRRLPHQRTVQPGRDPVRGHPSARPTLHRP